ncbi:MAG: glycosyltransferase, partial [Promethearchaeota archaeon]
WISVQTWKQWEQKILRSAPTITVSHEVAQSYKRVQPKTFVVPNLPNKREISLIPSNRNVDSEFRIAYIRRMAPQVSSSVLQLRFLSRFAPSMQKHLGAYAKSDAEVLELWETQRLGAKLVFVGHPVIDTEEVENHGFCSHEDMLSIIADCDAALLGKQIRFPFYSFQNTYSLVMHAGLKTLVHDTMLLQSQFNQQHNTGWTWSTGADLKQLVQRLVKEYFSDVAAWNAEKQRVRAIAKKHLIWEKYADQLKQAYEAVQQM